MPDPPLTKPDSEAVLSGPGSEGLWSLPSVTSTGISEPPSCDSGDPMGVRCVAAFTVTGAHGLDSTVFLRGRERVCEGRESLPCHFSCVLVFSVSESVLPAPPCSPQSPGVVRGSFLGCGGHVVVDLL